MALLDNQPLAAIKKGLIVSLSVLAVIYGSIELATGVVRSQDLYVAVIVGVIPVAVCVWVIIRSKQDTKFLLRLFVAGLLLRYLVGGMIYYKHWEQFFGGDAGTYDAFGFALLQSWQGLVDGNSPWLARYTGTGTSGFGMFYYVAALYYFIGQNPLAIQLINCALGAGTCVVGYKMAMLVYPQQRVARTVAIMTAFSPSLILWTSQGLKDGPILLFLCLCTLFTLKLREKFELKSLVLLLLSLFCLYTLRYYAAYILFVAMAGAFIFGAKRFTPLRILQGGLLVVVLGLAMVYFGGGSIAKQAPDLEQLQRVRAWGAKVSNTGFGGDVDITDPTAAIEFLPLGVLYVLLAPFPWMINNFRQLITLPELIAWWLLMPMMVKGYWYAVRRRLRESFVICIFILSLTLAFALYQSNAGTAYRHRAQLYVFFFIFISIGLDQRRIAKLNRNALVRTPPVLQGKFGSAIRTPVANGSVSTRMP